jgi:D-apiose dehydrogenase
MEKVPFAVVGAGFWAGFQISAWLELSGVQLIAICDRDRSRAEALAARYNVPNVYTNIDALLDNHAAELGFVDIITGVDSHAFFVKKVAARGLHVICQKPMGASLAESEQMVEACRAAGVRFFVHENFRFQTPTRRLKALLDSDVIGTPFRATISFCTAFPVFKNQPGLADLDQFIIADLGSHTLDMARFLFGEASHLYAQTTRVNPGIRGEDVAHILLTMQSGVVCYVVMSFASVPEQDVFPQTLISIDGPLGTLELAPNFDLRITTRQPDGSHHTQVEMATPLAYPWADPDYAIVHSSIVDCNANILSDLRGEQPAETTGPDNLQTVRLVQAAYASARSSSVIRLSE